MGLQSPSPRRRKKKKKKKGGGQRLESLLSPRKTKKKEKERRKAPCLVEDKRRGKGCSIPSRGTLGRKKRDETHHAGERGRGRFLPPARAFREGEKKKKRISQLSARKEKKKKGGTVLLIG